MTKREEFINELKALLTKFDVELSLEDTNPFGYGRVDQMVADFNWDKNEGIIPQIELGSWVSGDCNIK